MFVTESSGESTDVDRSTVVEIRVHGVGGAPPSQILNDPHPELHSGNALAGFWRRSTEGRNEWLFRAPWLPLRPRSELQPGDIGSPDEPPRADKYPTEAYAWGGLTSGDWSRSLWLLLFPYALANAAGWMHEPSCETEPAASNERTRAPLHKTLTTLFCLTLSVVAVWMVAHLIVDLAAIRCGWQIGACRVANRPVDWLVGFSNADWDFRWFQLSGGVGRLVAVSTLVPVAAWFGVWWAGRLSYRRYESYRPTPSGESRETERDLGLADPRFWMGHDFVGRLRRTHLTIGLLAAQTFMALVMLGVETEQTRLWVGLLVIGTGLTFTVAICAAWTPWFTDWITLTLRRVTLVLLGLSIAVAFGWPNGTPMGGAPPSCVCPTPASDELPPLAGPVAATMGLSLFQTALLLAMQGRARWPAFWSRLTDLVLVASALLFAVVPVMADRGWLDWSWLPDYDQRFFVFMRVWALPALLVVFLLTRRRFSSKKAFFGIGPTVVSALAAFSNGSVWSGTDGLAASYLEGDNQWLAGAQWFPWVSQSFAVLILLLIAAGFVVLLRSGRPSDLADARSQYEIGGDDRDGELRPIARAYRLRRMVAVADRWLAAMVAIALVLSAWLIGSDLALDAPQDEVGFLPQWFANVLILTAPLLVILSFRWAYRSPGGRRAVGALWDVLTFFPRVYHPFAPPCYGERAVPQLTDRLLRHTASPGGVVIRAHSQGTVVTAAALCSPGLSEGLASRRIRLVTFGSPLTVLYARVFPAYFGGLVGHLVRRFDPDGKASSIGWIHFRARTDPLGTKLFGYCDDQNPVPPSEATVDRGPIRDPVTLAAVEYEDPPPTLRHSTYWKHWKVDKATAFLCADIADDEALRGWAGI